MKVLLLAALVACAMAADSSAPRWPRLPLDLILRGLPQVDQQDEKIVGGAVVVPNSLPFQISLQRSGALGTFSQSCGGSILDENVIINAAHCVDGANVGIFRVVAGEHDLKKESGLEQNRDVTSYTQHENYNKRTFENDISLIFLSSPLDLTVPSAKPVTLPAKDLQFTDGQLLTVSGWGTTSSGGSISDQLQKVDVPFVNDADCNKAYGAGEIYDSMLCAGQGGKDSCQGDSGGPLFTDKDGVFTQVGIVSWGQGCALPNYPGVYTEVSYFLDWIEANRK